MAYTIAVGDIIAIQSRGLLHGQTWINTFTYRLAVHGGGTDGAAQLTALAIAGPNTYETFIDNNLAARQSQEVTNRRITVQVVAPIRRPRIDLAPAAVGGLVAENSLPSFVTVNIKKLTDRAGRAFRGRNYFAGIPASDELDSQLSAAAFTSWDGNLRPQVIKSISSAAGDVAVPVIWSPVNPALFTLITDSATDRVLRAQRRRQFGVGI